MRACICCARTGESILDNQGHHTSFSQRVQRWLHAPRRAGRTGIDQPLHRRGPLALVDDTLGGLRGGSNLGCPRVAFNRKHLADVLLKAGGKFLYDLDPERHRARQEQIPFVSENANEICSILTPGK
jgi:hypothetical protein